jgi:hypothetical protein
MFCASAFARSSFSFSVESSSNFRGSLAEVGREAGSAGTGCTVGVDGKDVARAAAAREAAASAGAGCTVGFGGEDRARVGLAAREGAASALMARTSRAISRQVSNSV